MNEQEINILVLKTLSDKSKTTEELAKELSSAGPVSDSEVFDILLEYERRGIVSRTQGDNFDENLPVRTTTWSLISGNSIPSNSNEDLFKTEVEDHPNYVKSAMIVVSQPIFLTVKGLDLGLLGVPVLSVREAMEKILIEAKEEIRIACPYYDELFIDILNKNARGISKLKKVIILGENSDPIILKACKLFPNMKFKTLYGSSSLDNQGRKYKVQGLHAKIMIADRSQVLIGSFNFLFSHVSYNVDLGLLCKGDIAEHYAKIFDSIWETKV